MWERVNNPRAIAFVLAGIVILAYVYCSIFLTDMPIAYSPKYQ